LPCVWEKKRSLQRKKIAEIRHVFLLVGSNFAFSLPDFKMGCFTVSRENSSWKDFRRSLARLLLRVSAEVLGHVFTAESVKQRGTEPVGWELNSCSTSPGFISLAENECHVNVALLLPTGASSGASARRSHADLVSDTSAWGEELPRGAGGDTAESGVLSSVASQ